MRRGKLGDLGKKGIPLLGGRKGLRLYARWDMITQSLRKPDRFALYPRKPGFFEKSYLAPQDDQGEEVPDEAGGAWGRGEE